MFLLSKKKRINVYLNNKSVGIRTPFDSLLEEYLSGDLKDKLSEIGLDKISIHIDWLDNHKCIGIQAKYNEYYMDCQIFEDEFTLSFDLTEADDDDEYSLTSKEHFYDILLNCCKSKNDS